MIEKLDCCSEDWMMRQNNRITGTIDKIAKRIATRITRMARITRIPSSP